MYKRDLWGYKCNLLNLGGDWNFKRNIGGPMSWMYKDLQGHKCDLLTLDGDWNF